MKISKDSTVAAITVASDMTRKSLTEVLRDARKKSEKPLLCLYFLMEWCLDGVNEKLPGGVSHGFAHIIHRCAYRAGERFAEHEALENLCFDLVKENESVSESTNEANSEAVG
jgi:hypothetical protein